MLNRLNHLNNSQKRIVAQCCIFSMNNGLYHLYGFNILNMFETLAKNNPRITLCSDDGSFQAALDRFAIANNLSLYAVTETWRDIKGYLIG